MPMGRKFAMETASMILDITKLSVHTREIGLAGIEVYDLLRDEYDIQIEFGDLGKYSCISFHRRSPAGYRASCQCAFGSAEKIWGDQA